MGFYRQLADSRPASCDVKLVVVGPKETETREEMTAYLAEHSLAVDGMQMVNFSDSQISTTPTLVLRDATRLVRGVWIGRLPDANQNEVVSRVRKFCSN